MKQLFSVFLIVLFSAFLAIGSASAQQGDDEASEGATGPVGPPEVLAIEHTRMEAEYAENSLENCSSENITILADCIAQALENLAKGLEDEAVKGYEPEVAKVVRNAAKDVRKGRSRAAIRRVLTRARRKIKTLASKVGVDRAAVFNRVSLVFKKAIRVLNKRF